MIGGLREARLRCMLRGLREARLRCMLSRDSEAYAGYLNDEDRDAIQWGLLADSGLLAPGNNGELQPGSPVWSAHYGSSFAAPLVTATVGLMLAAAPSLT